MRKETAGIFGAFFWLGACSSPTTATDGGDTAVTAEDAASADSADAAGTDAAGSDAPEGTDAAADADAADAAADALDAQGSDAAPGTDASAEVDAAPACDPMKCAGKPATCHKWACINDKCDDSTPIPSGTNCDDGNACTTGDVCADGGICVGAVGLCADPTTVCTVNVCDPNSGQCVPEVKPGTNGAPCDDGDACTQGEACNAGDCGGSSPVMCANTSGCAIASCDKVKGCVYTPFGATGGLPIACNDSDPCTSNDVCLASGVCAGTSVIATVPLQPCQLVSCDPVTGQLSFGTVSCDDGEWCTLDNCTVGTNACTHVPVAGGTTCDDGNPCTVVDTCTAGQCGGSGTPGNTKNCDDSNVCTTDSCNPQSGCQHANANGPCDDNNPCTISDACGSGTCAPGTPKNCDDGNTCTLDACDATGTCTHGSGPDMTACSDGNACTLNDLCLGGACTPGTAKSCDDGMLCTADVCNASSGACDSSASVPGCGPTFDDVNTAIFKPICATCHGAWTAAALVGQTAKAACALPKWVVKGQPLQSEIVMKVDTSIPLTAGCGGRMPQSNPGSLTAPQIQQIKDWIANGAVP